MRRRLALVMMALPLSLYAAHEGAWSSQSWGGVISRGQQEIKSRPLQPAGKVPSGAVVTRVSWRVHIDGTVPPGLVAQLCQRQSCLPLPALAGSLALPSTFRPDQPFWFRYRVNTRGALSPAITILGNQLTVNYQIFRDNPQ